MNKNPIVPAVIAIAALLIVVGGVIALSSANKPKVTTDKTASTQEMEHDSDEQTKNEPADTTPEATSEVAIRNFAFEPKSVTVKVGTTVTWTNNDNVSHDVVSDAGMTDGPSSDLLEKGKTYSFKFTKAGTYTYHCTPHPYMKGTVIVTE